jgi:predicted DNA repair protein MutK
MAGASLLTLIDDIATLLDDVSVMSKVAAKKTAGVLGDDLALNAEQVTGFPADRELPVIWAVAKGSAVNKVILIAAALGISALLPQAITPLLMMGGAFLCYEGFEKVYHKLFHEHKHDAKEVVENVKHGKEKKKPPEKERIKGAIRTDFILSAEILVITLNTVSDAAFSRQLMVLIVMSVAVVVGVYGLVAGIVKLDDAGLALQRTEGDSGGAKFKRKFGSGLLTAAPILMKMLGIFGTIAMFLVGGGIIAHGIHAIGHTLEHWAHMVADGFLGTLTQMGLEGVFGVLIGAVLVAVVNGVKKIRSSAAP